MHRVRDIQVGIFEPWDWVYFQELPCWAGAGICQILVQTPFLMVLNTGIQKSRNVGKLAKNPIWRGSGSGPNPSTSRPRIKNAGRSPGRQISFSLYSKFQLSRCRNVEKIGNIRTDGRTDRRIKERFQ
jgi:hypothetical protein